MATKDIFSILKKRFPDGQYALMQEVSDAAGFNRSRSADYIAVGLWPSRGLSVHGIELKSFRNDWLNEKKNPKKAENIFQYCDFFWLLTADEHVAKVEEIPENWGWMRIDGKKIVLEKDAPKLQPVSISRNFLAAMLKRANDKTNFVHKDSIQDAINEAKEQGKKDQAYYVEQLKKQFADIKGIVSEFESASGIQLDGYRRWITDPTKIGKAVNFIINGGADGLQKRLLELEKIANKINNDITDGIRVLDIEINQPENQS